MAFALWIDDDLAWAQGLHEYRPMGVAVISVTDRFRPRDFRPGRRTPTRGEKSYAGLFASLGDLNAHLARLSTPRSGRPRRAPTPAWV